jgi:hypothetical protein
MIGLDQDSVIITANVFNPGFVGASMFAIAKARLYNGLGWSVPFYQGLNGTLAPPVVLDQNPNTYLLVAPAYASPGGNTLLKYTLTNSAYPAGQTLSGPTSIAGPITYQIPPDADQLGTSAKLDTLDGRFENHSTQLGNSIWNVHCADLGGGTSFAWSWWYEIDTAANTVLNSGNMVASADSDDFMPHITVNTIGDVFVVWTASSPTIYSQMRISGKQVSDVSNNLGPGSLVRQSSTYYTGFRWGDYQTIDVAAGPNWGNPKVAFAVGEYVTGTNFWRTRISRVVMP